MHDRVGYGTYIVVIMKSLFQQLLNLFFLLDVTVDLNPIFCEGSPSFSCPNGSFRLNDLGICQPLLTCKEIENLEFGDLIGYGSVKQIYKTKWRNRAFALVTINNELFIEDFLNGLNYLRLLTPHSGIVNLIGTCSEGLTYITEYYPNGNAHNLQWVTNFFDRFTLCLNYIKIIRYLHSYSLVMCDSNTLNKTLEQFLITDSLDLVLCDTDSLAEIDKNEMICGHQQIMGKYVAPEQLWPYHNQPYDKSLMPPYNEKIDIWKIPSVCNYFLGFSRDASLAKYQLFKVNKMCRNPDPRKRPTADEALVIYENVFKDMNLKKSKEEL